MRSIGIDLGEDSVKIVELIQNKKTITLNSLFEKKLSASSSPQDQEIESIEFVRSVIAQNDFSGSRFCMALRQDKVTVRTKTFPFSDRIKIQKSLSFEMEEDIPFDPDMCLFDYKTISFEGNAATVLALAVPKVHIEKALSLAKDFGIELSLLTVEGFAFSNLLENWQDAAPHVQTSTAEIEIPSEDTAFRTRNKIDIILNIGHKRTLMSGLSNGRVIFVRSLMWGADSILQEMLKRYQLPYVEAQKILQTNASLYLTKQNRSFEEINLAGTIEQSLRELVRDLQMSFLELQSATFSQIQNVYLTGGLSQLPNLGPFLTQHLEVACNPIQLLNPYLKTDYGIYSIDTIQLQFANAVGIALEAYKKPKNPSLQLIKGEFLSQNNKFRIFWEDWGSITQVVIASFIVLVTWGYFREDFSRMLEEKGIEALNAQAKSVARLPKKQANEKGVIKYIKDHKKQTQEMKLVTQIASMNSAMDILKKVSDQAPGKDQAKIDLVQFNVRDEMVQLSGYANSPKEITLLSERLASLSVNNKVNQDQTALVAVPNRVAFTLSFKTDRGLVK
jgi:general secretion pathway protein L